MTRLSQPEIVRMFLAETVARPEAPAIIGTDGSHLTYRQLDSVTAALAGWLAARGVGRGDLVGVRLPRGPELITAMFGVLRAGAAYVPIDPAYPPERTAQIVADADCALILDELPQDLPHRTAPAVATHPAELAYVIYTSGSSGRPKGVMISHAAIGTYAGAMAAEYGVGPDDRWLQFSSTSFDASIEDIVLTLTSGAALVPRTDEMLDPAQLLTACDRLGITVVNLPTEFWHQLVGVLAAGAPVPRSLRLVLIGGEKARSGPVQTWLSDGRLRHIRLVNGYGPTEATIAATIQTVEDLDAGQTVPIGSPVPGVEVHVLDDRLDPVPVGHAGQIF
ncbi:MULTISPECIES: AMP-binding protein, partial [unclassified Nonomuraea]|uniref:AMP-binding protein n=1 Tax=unclassified Nonomuraea TaxID=2593643 RepID=UPI0033CF2FC5